MFELRKTDIFGHWLDTLKDIKGRARILARLDRLADGNPGDTKRVGAGVSELRINFGPGYRVYYTKRGRTIVILLCGGDKGTQQKDIERATRVAQDLPE